MNPPIKTFSLLVFITLVCVCSSYAAPKPTTNQDKDKGRAGYVPSAATGTQDRLQGSQPVIKTGISVPIQTDTVTSPNNDVTLIPAPVCTYVQYQGAIIERTRWDPAQMNGQSDLFGRCPPGYRCAGNNKCEWKYGTATAMDRNNPDCTWESQDCRPTLG